MSKAQSMGVHETMNRYLPRIEKALQEALQAPLPTVTDHHNMMHYHMGWLDDRFQTSAVGGGKRLRPLLCLLACQAVGGEVSVALPAAAAMEILHNFSLAHDDIEDNSRERRGRPALWTLWGVPQAINVGDALFALAHRTLGQLSDHDVPAWRILAAIRSFDRTCVALTEGQYLDMSFESRRDVTVDEYLEMVEGKTAALIGLSAELGALLGDAPPPLVAHFLEFGRQLGIAFQIEDDILGIWGDESLTGKSASSDIREKKKTLPVVYGLGSTVGLQLKTVYGEQEITEEDLPSVLALLHEVDALGHTQRVAEASYQRALAALNATGLGDAALAPLRELTAMLKGRDR